MENKIHNLPPHKRFNFPVTCCLPAKKRKETRDPPPIPTNLETIAAGNTVCLPAKKRILALHPNVFPDKPSSSIDLNIEYDPESDDGNIPVNEIEDVNEDGVVCAVCQSTDGDPSDPIVFCDGCNLMVHTTCYGYPLTNVVPEGDWFCSQCQITDQNKGLSLSCCLCSVNGGALKPTNDCRWAHIVCALFVPEVYFCDPEGREGIDCSKIPARRWGNECYVCKKMDGCVLDCSEEKCCLRFHVTCGLKEDLCIEYKEGKNRSAIVVGFCKSHTDLWKKQQVTGKFKIVARNE
ncbi:hypothetical protein R6Q57_008972 [Mikania cordata]